MPRQLAATVENNFKNGLVTEASGLNFPENACTETYDCVFNFDGSVQRRGGIDFELGFSTKTINRSNCAINTYLWKNVAGNGNVTLVVVQVGATIYFYETSGTAVSAGAVASNVALSGFAASGAPSTETEECQFSSGNGLLFVTHPYCDPFYVSYDTSTQTATGTKITLKIRDLGGDTADVLAVDNRPTATLAGLNVNHMYNLYNQGWNTTNLTSWDTARTDMPSNSDVMWSFKNASDVFDTATIANVVNGNSPAPKGHFTLSLHDQDRDTAAGTSGATHTTTSYQRPSTSAFFAGRLFYAGINYTGFNSRIYFSQIVETNAQYAYCYQANDPTAEDAFDLLPSDGGYLNIQEAGTIFKLVSIIGALIVFAANGVWTITGSTGVGFTATDYTVAKVSSVSTISASSFVDVNGIPAWWNREGIYMLTSQQGAVGVESMTMTRIKTFFDTIPSTSKLTAKGFFNRITGIIQWIYRSTSASSPDETYTYDRALNFNTRINAFYPWTISASTRTVNGVLVFDGTSGQAVVSNVIDGSSNNVVDASGNQVVSYVASNPSVTPIFIYLCSYANSGSHKFTFGKDNGLFVDWTNASDPQTYESYFISGYKLHGGAIRKFQQNYIRIFSQLDSDSEFFIQGIWDYATSGDTGRWSSRQFITHTAGDYSNSSHRRKIRGHGLALQLKVVSNDDKPFHIIGWSTQESANAAP